MPNSIDGVYVKIIQQKTTYEKIVCGGAVAAVKYQKRLPAFAACLDQVCSSKGSVYINIRKRHIQFLKLLVV